jgi:hypothetical protein
MANSARDTMMMRQDGLTALGAVVPSVKSTARETALE